MSTRMTRLIVGATLATAYVAATTHADAASSPTATCAAAKMKAGGKRSRDVLACHARAILHATTADAACVAKADAALAGTFTTAESRGSCAHTGDAAAIGAESDAFVAAALAATPSAANEAARCRAAVVAAAARTLPRALGAEAGFKRKPDAPLRLVAGRHAAFAALDTALARSRCTTRPDGGTIGRVVAEHVATVVARLACGDGVRDTMEQCDGTDDAGCPSACDGGCRCPAASEAFACLAGPGPVVALDGPHAQHYEDLALAPATKLDARAGTFAAGPDNHYPLNLGGGPGVCLAGGVVQGSYDRALDWATMHDMNNAAVRSEGAGFTFDGLRADDVTDGIRPVGGPFTIRQAWLSYVRDDCLENDHVRGGLVIDSLFDGCYVAVSERPSPVIAHEHIDGRHDVLAIHRSLIRLAAMPGPRDGAPGDTGHGQFFKWDTRATALALHDDVFLAEQIGQSGADTMGIPDALVSCANNVMVWLGGGPYPAPLPPCFTVTTDRGVWDAAVADWNAKHPAVGSVAP